MKKFNLIFGILLIGMMTLSCTSDNDSNETYNKQELLIGKWKKIKIGVICSSGSETSEEYSICKQNGTITFKSDGTYIDIPYIEYNDECIIDGESNGTWEIIDNELYIKESGNANAVKATLFEVSQTSLKIGGDLILEILFLTDSLEAFLLYTSINSLERQGPFLIMYSSTVTTRYL